MKPTKRQKETILRTLEHAVVAVRDIPESALRELIPHIERTRVNLIAELKKWEKFQDNAATYTIHTRRSALYQLEGALAEIRALGPQMAGTLTSASMVAGDAAISAMGDELAALSDVFSGSTVPISIDRAAVLAKGEGLLLHRYPVSAKRYAGETLEAVKGVLTRGVLRQESITQTTNRMYAEFGDVFDGARSRAERLVRTEVMNSYNEHHLGALEEAHSEDSDVRMRWDASYDPRRCAECARLDGMIVDVSSEFEAKWKTPAGKRIKTRHRRPPAHPNCFVPNTVVEGAFVGGLKAFYSGEMVELSVKSGSRISVTPNHPILTDRGWVSAGEVSKEDRLLRYRRNADAPASPGGFNIENPPAAIDEVFSLIKNSGASAARTTSAGDLHGDAAFVDGDVEIVSIYGPLDGAGKSDGLGDFSGVEADTGLRPESSDSSGGKFFVGSDHSPDSSMGGANLEEPLSCGHTRPLHPLRLGLASELNASLGKPSTDDPAVNSEFARELIDRGAGDIFFDDVIEVRKFHYSGHVYDLQSVGGWLVADGIVASNCRCVLVPWIDEWPDAEWTGKPPEEPKKTTIPGL